MCLKQKNNTIKKGRSLLHRGKYNQAINLYKKGFEKVNNDLKYNIYNGLGNCYRCLKEYNKAIKYYKKAIKNKPKDAPGGLYWSNISFCYAQFRKWDKAIEAAKKALSLLKKEEATGIKHGNQLKILDLEIKLYKEYKKRD